MEGVQELALCPPLEPELRLPHLLDAGTIQQRFSEFWGDTDAV